MHRNSANVNVHQSSKYLYLWGYLGCRIERRLLKITLQADALWDLLLEGRSTCAALGGHHILPMHRNCSRLWLELLELFYYKYIYEFCQSDGGLSFLSVFVFISLFRWPACWAYACSGSLPLDLYMFNYCIILLFMLWRIKFSLSLAKWCICAGKHAAAKKIKTRSGILAVAIV